MHINVCMWRQTDTHICPHLYNGNLSNYATRTESQSAKQYGKVVRILHLLPGDKTPKKGAYLYLRKQIPANIPQSLLTSQLLNAADNSVCC